MSKYIKLVACFLITIVVILCGFTSCTKNREYKEDEVLAAAKKLIMASEDLNEIYYGKGILWNPDLNYANGSYYRADENSLKSYGIGSLDDLKAKTRDVYTQELSNVIIQTKLSSISDDNGIHSYARYYENRSGDESYVMVYSKAEVFLDGEAEYHYDELSVKGSVGQVVYVLINVTVSDKDGNSQKRELQIGLIEENGAWKIDTPTYIKYVDLDYYYDKTQGSNKK
jgi:hypothetical protein